MLYNFPQNLLSQIPFLRSPVCLKIFIWLLLHFVQRPTPPVPAATLEYLYAPAAGTTFLYGFWRAEDQVVVVDALSLKTQTGCRAFCVEWKNAYVVEPHKKAIKISVLFKGDWLDRHLSILAHSSKMLCTREGKLNDGTHDDSSVSKVSPWTWSFTTLFSSFPFSQKKSVISQFPPIWHNFDPST